MSIDQQLPSSKHFAGIPTRIVLEISNPESRSKASTILSRIQELDSITDHLLGKDLMKTRTNSLEGYSMAKRIAERMRFFFQKRS